MASGHCEEHGQTHLLLEGNSAEMLPRLGWARLEGTFFLFGFGELVCWFLFGLDPVVGFGIHKDGAFRTSK